MEAIWIKKTFAPVMIGATRPAGLVPQLLPDLGRGLTVCALAAQA
jgi:hypothetical protein